MQKIGDITNTADSNGEYTNGNVAAGIPPTILESGWFNTVQREMINVLLKAGMKPDKTNDAQLSEAIRKLVSDSQVALTDSFGQSSSLAASQKLVTHANDNANRRLDKAQNGADIEDKAAFVNNLGLSGTATNESVDNKLRHKVNIEPGVLNGSDLISEQLMGGFGVAIRGSAPIPADAPTVDGAIKVVQIGNNAWPTLLAFSAYENKMFIRTRKESNGSWNDWLEITDCVTSASLSSGLSVKLDKSSVVYATGSSATQVMSQQAVTDRLFGINQSWRDVTKGRSLGATYENSSKKAIAFVVTAYSERHGCSVGASVDGIDSPGTFNYKVNAFSSSSLMIVPPGSSYSARISAGEGYLIKWLELS
ncbi:tail fiber protein [Xenorhabdus budapestensis]|uniref:Tail fiber protein n=1 Tax=Xenorhabdus budapestensis TaxID=290110 RepID=A0A2D0J167_XENBU|nr:tail fiber protein [Xenorhabdus budapestensis]PHM27836.1 tail fiber protein [Xenorhabdus budapestensis]